MLVLGGSAALLGPGPRESGSSEPQALSSSVLWVRQFGTPGNDGAYAVALGPGGLYVAGTVEGSLGGQPHAGATDAFLRKFDLDGNTTWTRQFGNASVDEAWGVAADGSAAYVAGFIADRGFVQKHDPAGNVLWYDTVEPAYPDFSDRAAAVAVEGDALFVVGWADTPSRGRDAFLYAADTSLTSIRVVSWGSSEYDWASAVAADGETVLMGGGTAGLLFDGPNNGTLTDAYVLQWNVTQQNMSYGWWDQFRWTDDSGNHMNEGVDGLAVAEGNVYAVGGTERRPGFHAFAKMYREDGTEMWNETFNASAHDVAWDVYADATGAYAAGHTGGAYPGETNAGAFDAFVRHYDETGSALWTRQFGTSAEDIAWGITGDGTFLYVVGETEGAFPGQTRSGGKDAFVAKLRLEANRPPVPSAGGPYVGTEGSPITFNGNGSTDPDGDALTYRWDFEADGTWDTGWSASPTATHTWGDDWSGTARVEVSDGNLTAKAEASVVVTNVSPSPIEWTTPSGDEGASLTFRVRIVDPGSDDLTVTWSGDCTGWSRPTFSPNDPSVVPDPDPSPDLHPRDITDAQSIVCGDNGMYEWSLRAEDDDGGTVSVTASTLSIDNVPPSLTEFPPSLLAVDEGTLVALDATATDPGSDDLTSTWSWQHGPTETRTEYNDGVGPDPPDSPNGTYPFSASDTSSRTYGDDGSYLVTLVVSDDDSGSLTYTTTIQVSNVAPTVDAGPDLATDEGTFLDFGLSFSDPGFDEPAAGTVEDFTATVDWGDGTSEALAVTELPGGPGVPTTGTIQGQHAYADNGRYTVTVTVCDDDGGCGSDALAVDVANVAPTVDAGPDVEVDEATALALAFSFSDPGFDFPPGGTAEDFAATVDWGYGPPDAPAVSEVPGGPGTPTTGTIAVAHTYGDNGAFVVTVIVCDDDGGCGTDTMIATVRNVDPTIDDVQVYVTADVRLRVAGERWHDVRMDLEWNGAVTGTASVVRTPGSPDDQSIEIEGARLQLLGDFRITLTYTPEDDPLNGQPNGANPAWVILAMPNGTEVWLQHTFNVKQPATWTWTLYDFRPYLMGQEVTFEAIASDVGSDDLTFGWDFGDGGTDTATYYNDGAGPDPFPSPEVNPIAVTYVARHAFGGAGTYTITLTVTDDDGSTATWTFTLAVGG